LPTGLIGPFCALVMGGWAALVTPAAAQSYTFSSLSGQPSTPGVAVDSAGHVYSVSTLYHSVYKVSPSGNLLVFAGSGNTQVSGSVDGIGPSARFNNPRALAVDATGTVYVADAGNNSVRKISPAGVVTTLAGAAGTRGWDDGVGGSARFDNPQGIAVDAKGNVFVADTNSRTIRKITADGTVTTFAGLGYVTGSADGTGLAARFDQPQGIAVDASGTIYVADTSNHTIRRITPTGEVTTLAGSPTNRGEADGVGNLARFFAPQALAVDATGTLFVADSLNSTIRKVTPAGVVTTIGGLAGFSGDATGTGAVARFNTPRGIAVSPSGMLYIADFYLLKQGAPANQLAITVQPSGQSVASGSTLVLSVTATGAPPLTFQWQKDGLPISGATNSTLPLVNVQPSTGGSYTVAVTNPVTTVTSNPALLTVLSPLLNDNFANAQALTGASGQVTGNNNGATGEIGEPTHAVPPATASSVWYR
jgi:hypothetical protein